jgi:hypothetical protein
MLYPYSIRLELTLTDDLKSGIDKGLAQDLVQIQSPWNVALLDMDEDQMTSNWPKTGS